MSGGGFGGLRRRAVSGVSIAGARPRDRVAVAWAAGGRGRRIAIVLVGATTAALVGAFLFGAWHVLFGGFVKENWRAGAFGLVLAAVAAGLLAGEAEVIRRRLP